MSFLKYLLPGWKNLLTDKSSANAGILAAIDTEMSDTEIDIINSKSELSLDTADSKWLDLYGNLIGLYRQNGETDSSFRTRIINYVKIDKVTVPAIKAAVQTFLNDNTVSVDVYEPYKNIFMLNGSHLNGTDALQGHYYTTAVIDIKLSILVPSGLAEYLNAYTPSGVTVIISPNSLSVQGGDFTSSSYKNGINGGDFNTTFNTTVNGGQF